MRMNDRHLPTARRHAPGLATRLHNAAAGLARAWRSRRTLRRLGEFEDHQLLDIGLCRADVREAVTSSFFSDSGLHLTIAARERARRHLHSGFAD